VAVKRSDWLRACSVARRGGTIRPALANLIAAYRAVNDRVDWRAYADPFGG